MLPQAKAAKEESIRQDVAGILRPFYCELCAKQYKKASEFEAHLGSYDHHHKKRLRELREAESNRAKEERQRREQKREEREMAKAQEMAVQAAAVAAAIAAPTPRSEWKTGGKPGAAPYADGIRARKPWERPGPPVLPRARHHCRPLRRRRQRRARRPWPRTGRRSRSAWAPRSRPRQRWGGRRRQRPLLRRYVPCEAGHARTCPR